MTRTMKRLSDAELEIMNVLWDAGCALSRMDIEKGLADIKAWAPTTVLTFLARLIEKGFVSCEKHGRFNMYSAYIGRKQYLEWENRMFLDRFYDSSVANFVASACQGRDVSAADIEELRRLLSGMKMEKELEG